MYTHASANSRYTQIDCLGRSLLACPRNSKRTTVYLCGFRACRQEAANASQAQLRAGSLFTGADLVAAKRLKGTLPIGQDSRTKHPTGVSDCVWPEKRPPTPGSSQSQCTIPVDCSERDLNKTLGQISRTTRR